MIDTDKYEGHTEGKWILGEYKGRPSISAVEDVETPTWERSIARGLNPSQTADHALLLDAPLLLAEVKRLRKINEFHMRIDREQTKENLEVYKENERLTKLCIERYAEIKRLQELVRGEDK
tara:strand:+ start:569 stop:931 length:363 start_codon:yes stop_codon:yes gene_type:complete